MIAFLLRPFFFSRASLAPELFSPECAAQALGMVEEHLLDKAVRTLDPSVIHDHRSVSMQTQKRVCRTGPTAETTTVQTQMTAPLPAASIITKLAYNPRCFLSRMITCVLQGPQWVWPVGYLLRAIRRFGNPGSETCFKRRYRHSLCYPISVPQTNLVRLRLLRRCPAASTRRGRCVSRVEERPVQFASFLCSQGNPRALQRPRRTLRCLLSDTGL